MSSSNFVLLEVSSDFNQNDVAVEIKYSNKFNTHLIYILFSIKFFKNTFDLSLFSYKPSASFNILSLSSGVVTDTVIVLSKFVWLTNTIK